MPRSDFSLPPDLPQGAVNLQLPLEAGGVLQLLELVRQLPGRRFVFRGLWQQQTIFAKLFIGRNAARYASRDALGAGWMLGAKLPTPALLWRGFAQFRQTKAQVLVYAAVPNALNAADAYCAADSQARSALMHLLVNTLAAQHIAGLRQTDLHLKNFLIAQGVVWSIDGDGIRQQTLSIRQSHKQLAELISKLHLLDQMQLTKTLLDCYLLARGWAPSISSKKVLLWAMHMKAREVENYVNRKIFRNCTDVRWQQTPREAQAVSVAGGLQPITIEQLEAAMAQSEALKQGNTCTVHKAQLQGRTVVIKRYNIKNCWHALSRAWRPSRAAASWINAHRLQYDGIATPQPLLLLEQRFYGLRGKAFYVSEYSPWPDAQVFFKQTTDKRLRVEAVKQIATLCYQLYLLKLSHGDMKASNLQITDLGQVVVLDLDSMRQHHCASIALRAHVKDLHRLLQNWKDDSSLYNALLKSLRVVYADPTPLIKAGISI